MLLTNQLNGQLTKLLEVFLERFDQFIGNAIAGALDAATLALPELMIIEAHGLFPLL